MGYLIFCTIIFIVAVACIGNLIVGAFLNALRESKGKPKKKRTSLIIFDIVMILFCVGVYNMVSSIYYAAEESKEEWTALYTVINADGSIVPNVVAGTYPTLNTCKAELGAFVYTGDGFIQKSGCANLCTIDGNVVSNVSTCTEFERF